jgi:hypothetical protein
MLFNISICPQLAWLRYLSASTQINRPARNQSLCSITTDRKKSAPNSANIDGIAAGETETIEPLVAVLSIELCRKGNIECFIQV